MDLGGGGESLGLNEVLGSSGNIRGNRLRDGHLSGNNVVVASNNLLDSGLNGPVSNNSVFNMVLNYCKSSSTRVMSLYNSGWGMGNDWCMSNNCLVCTKSWLNISNTLLTGVIEACAASKV